MIPDFIIDQQIKRNKKSALEHREALDSVNRRRAQILNKDNSFLRLQKVGGRWEYNMSDPDPDNIWASVSR